MSESPDLVFYVQKHPIGLFQTGSYPSAAGWYRYDPYRGEGHAILAEKIKSGETLTAWFPAGDTRRYFKIDKESFDAERSNGKWQVHILRFESA